MTRTGADVFVANNNSDNMMMQAKTKLTCRIQTQCLCYIRS